MKSDSATNVKNNFSAYLDRVKRGESVLILEYGRPVAQLSKPSLSQTGELGLAGLEREGLVSRPTRAPLDAESFLSQRVKLHPTDALSDALRSDREESR